MQPLRIQVQTANAHKLHRHHTQSHAITTLTTLATRYTLYITLLVLTVLFIHATSQQFTIYKNQPKPQQLSRYLHTHTESLIELQDRPLLLSILSANNVSIAGDREQMAATAQQGKQQYTDTIMTQIKQNLKLANPYTSPISMSSPPTHPTTTSTYYDTYPIQQFENVCITATSPLKFVLLGDKAKTDEIIVGNKQFNQKKQYHKWESGNTYRWIPYRYQDGYAVVQMDEAEPQWKWVSGVTYHTAIWDINPGHIFHQQIWPLFVGLHYARAINPELSTPMQVQIGEACQTFPSKTGVTDPYIGVFGANWQAINRLFAHIAVVTAPQGVTMLQAPDDYCHTYDHQTLTGAGLCYEKLIVSDYEDMYMSLHKYSAIAMQQLRTTVLDYLHLTHTKPGVSAIRTRPLRVTIYSRHDASRRRITNVDAITTALSPYHIVRHITQFGSRDEFEQLALYADTDILIAPHGAHMTWSFALPSNAVIVECFTFDSVTNPAFSWIQHMAASLNIKHIQHLGIANMTTVTEGNRVMDADFEVNVGRMCAELREYNIQCDAWATAQ